MQHAFFLRLGLKGTIFIGEMRFQSERLAILTPWKLVKMLYFVQCILYNMHNSLSGPELGRKVAEEVFACFQSK